MAESASAELWIKLTLPGVGQIGPGKIALLRMIDEHQSIAAAARAMDMSYRRAWLLVDELNGLFAQPVVAKWQGGKSKGGASLTKFGEQLVKTYLDMVERSNAANRQLLRQLGREAASKAAAKSA
jgi:molybdate transport system regulatory protein